MQYSHSPHVSPGFTTTRSPSSRSSTSSPTFAISPAMSLPRMCGRGSFRVGMPVRTNRSRWFSAHARTRTRTSDGPIAGSWKSVTYSRTSGPPWVRKITAFIDAVLGERRDASWNHWPRSLAWALGRLRQVDDSSFVRHPLGLLLAGGEQLHVRDQGAHDPVLRLPEMFLVRRAAQALALRDRLRRDLPGRGVVAVSVGLEDRVHLLLRELREQAVHPDAGGQDAQAQFPLPDQLRGPSFVEIAEQVPGLRLVEPDHAEVPPAVLVHRRRGVHEIVLFPYVPGAIEGVARAPLQHEDPGLRPLDPLVDDAPRLP